MTAFHPFTVIACGKVGVENCLSANHPIVGNDSTADSGFAPRLLVSVCLGAIHFPLGRGTKSCSSVY